MIEPFEKEIRFALETWGNRPPHDLELSATIHFVKHLFPDVPTDEILRRVKALKPKFEDHYIRDHFEELERLGLIEVDPTNVERPF